MQSALGSRRHRLCGQLSSKRGNRNAECVLEWRSPVVRRRSHHCIGCFGSNVSFVRNANRHREGIRNHSSEMNISLPIWTRTMVTTATTARSSTKHANRKNSMFLHQWFGSMTTTTTSFHTNGNPWVVALGIAALTSTVAAAWTAIPASNNKTECDSVESVPPLLDVLGTSKKDESERDKSNIGARIIGNPPHRGSSPDESTVEDSALPNSSFAFYEYLLEQLQVVRYVEDRDAATITSDSGRNKPTGLVGLACVHCMRQGRRDSDSSSFPQESRERGVDQNVPPRVQLPKRSGIDQGKASETPQTTLPTATKCNGGSHQKAAREPRGTLVLSKPVVPNGTQRHAKWKRGGRTAVMATRGQ